jgi:hypothetical protein
MLNGSGLTGIASFGQPCEYSRLTDILFHAEGWYAIHVVTELGI